MTAISRNITAHMERHNLTQTALAERVGVVTSTICGLVNRRDVNPRLRLLIALADEMEMTIDQLIGYEGKRK